MTRCHPDNFACLFDTLAGTVGASPLSFAIVLGVSFFLAVLTASIFH